jgi:MOSC domain-containing protein YiiM
MARLLSVNVGLPNDIAWRGQTVHTAVWKRAVSGRRMARRLNLDGDGQGDLIGHGGEHRAVFVYQIDCYRYWQRELGRDDFSFGQFGENFTVEGLPDDEVCIGDRYRIGSVIRGDPAACDLLPHRHPNERAQDGRAARLPRQARLLLPCA